MKARTLSAVAGATALTVGSVAVLVQYLVTPISGQMSAKHLVSAAADHHTAMTWALALDFLCILVIPAVTHVGRLAGSEDSPLALVATGLCLVPAIGGVVLFANDAVVYEASRLSDRSSAVALVKGFEGNALISGLAAIYLFTHVIGFVLLAVALRRRRAVPLFAVVLLAVWPLFEMAGYAADSKPLAAVGYAALAVGYVTCARQVLVSRSGAPLPASPGALVTPRLGS